MRFQQKPTNMGRHGTSGDKAAYHLFSDDYTYHGHYGNGSKIRVMRYNPEKIEEKTVDPATENFSYLVRDGYVNWIEVSGLADSRTIGRIVSDFGFPPVDCKAVLTPNHAAKIDDLNNRIIIILRSCSYEKNNSVSSEHIALLSKDNLVITFKEKYTKLFATVANAIRQDTMNIRSSDRIMLVAFLLNAIFSQTIECAVRVEEMLERLDDVMLNAPLSKMHLGQRIQQCRHANLILQKNNIPLHSEFRNITESDVIVNDETMMQIFDELSNELDFILLTSNNSKELLASIRDLYASYNEQRTNSIMKRLTIVSTLFIPITFLVGLWGMNFRLMPELDWTYGYPVALIILLLTALGTWEYMKRNNWF